MFDTKAIDLVLLSRMMKRASWDTRGGGARLDVQRLSERRRTGRVVTATSLTVSQSKWLPDFRGARVKCDVSNLLPGWTLCLYRRTALPVQRNDLIKSNESW